jgi:hypothetical protein
MYILRHHRLFVTIHFHNLGISAYKSFNVREYALKLVGSCSLENVAY